jgi:carbonic anhydrase
MKQHPKKRGTAPMAVGCAVIVGACTNGDHGVHWGYSGDVGPEHWGDLSPEFAIAKTGREQSPVDISNPRVVAQAPIEITYRPGALEVVNNGHTIQVNCPAGSTLDVDGTRYDLQQFHFHSPSEHTIGGRHAALEMHLVHADAAGALAVVAVMLEEGAHNGAFDPVWSNMPEHAGPPVRPAGVTVDPGALLPVRRGCFRLPGSLTTPPCSEGVQWLVMDAPVELSSRQITAFRRIYHGNNRPVQPLNDRVILHSP